jgi:uncharacterized membrane protein
MTFIKIMHILAAALWVGGLFFAFVACKTGNPKATEQNPAWVRSALQAQRRMLAWGLLFALILLFSGHAMLPADVQFGQMEWPQQAMAGLGLAMFALTFYALTAPARKADSLLEGGFHRDARAHLLRIRNIQTFNLWLALVLLILGLLTRPVSPAHGDAPSLPEETQAVVTPPTPVQDSPPPTVETLTPVTTTPPQAEAAPASLFQQRLSASDDWLARELPNNHTVQVMLLFSKDAEKNLEAVLQKLDSASELPNLYIYVAGHGDTRRYGVTYGNFSTREEALQARRALPVALRGSPPLIRTLHGIRNEIVQK